MPSPPLDEDLSGLRSDVDPVLSETDLLLEFARPSFINGLAVINSARGQLFPPWQVFVIV
ncbi:hypothetical protein SAMN06295879_1587 [Agreia bicolorata]|uniref:Uncharacterized protein n=1 Tax=Agreia bicolorata TaxID=110935 RepID=A0A1T4XTP9_9MICO|nr:hypothetical protein SAMN06295879_1587 [Agreia bicolorata]